MSIFFRLLGGQTSELDLLNTFMTITLKLTQFRRTTLISPNTPEVEYLQSPSTVTWLKDIALRDLALHEKHGACVDAMGDVYQWGTAYRGEGNVSNEPVLSLKGKVSVRFSSSVHVLDPDRFKL